LSPRHTLSLLGLLALTTLAIGLLAGSIRLPASELLGLFTGQAAPLSQNLIMELRLPRVINGFCTGAMLALAGVLMQVLLRNPLADPYILGVSGGAGVAVLLSMLAGAGGLILTGSAFLGALASTLLVFALARSQQSGHTTRLLLTGVVVAMGWGALISFILAIAPSDQLRGMLFWLMGDLSYGGLPYSGLVILAIALALTLHLARDLNVLTRGETQAAALGVEVSPLRIKLYVIASLLTAGAVTQAGSIGFIGLVVPHLLRLLGLTDHRLLIPAAVLLGGTLLVLADTLARTVIAPQQLPAGIITALIGVPVFLYLLARRPL